MSDINFSTSLRTDRMNQVKNKLDADTNPGYVEFYTATRPAAGAAITTQTKIGTCMLSKPCGTVSAGVLTFDLIADDISADASGDINWARLHDGAGSWVMDAGCGLSGSGKTFIFNTLTVIMGGLVEVLSGSLTEGNA